MKGGGFKARGGKVRGHMMRRALWKSFRSPFSKGGALKGAEPLSPRARGEIPPFGVFFW